jgi:hypothetical protein
MTDATSTEPGRMKETEMNQPRTARMPRTRHMAWLALATAVLALLALLIPSEVE